jgi:hypothetical protein
MSSQALGLNFQGFPEKKTLFPYQNLFVSQSPNLKDKPLCEFLAKMDQEEYGIVLTENQKLLEDTTSQWDKKRTAIVLGAMAYLGITALFHEKLGLGIINNPFKKIFHIAGIFACLASMYLWAESAYGPMYRIENEERTIKGLNKAREARIHQKFTATQDEYRKLKAASSTSTQKSPEELQLREAKRHFKRLYQQTGKSRQ